MNEAGPGAPVSQISSTTSRQVCRYGSREEHYGIERVAYPTKVTTWLEAVNQLSRTDALKTRTGRQDYVSFP